MATQRPVEIAVAIVRLQDAVLMGPRPEGKVLAGYWEFPGGKIQAGESPARAATRECLEETGLRIQTHELLAVVDHRYDHGMLRLHFVDASPIDPDSPPQLPFRWIPTESLGDYRFPPANAEVLRILNTRC